MWKTFNMTWQHLILMQEPPKISRRPLKCLQGKGVAIWGRIPKAKFFLGHPVVDRLCSSEVLEDELLSLGLHEIKLQSIFLLP